MKVWNSKTHTAEQALELPEDRLMAAVFGMNIEQGVDPDKVLEAAAALIESDLDFTLATQAKVMVTAQEKGFAFQDWAGRLATFS